MLETQSLEDQIIESLTDIPKHFAITNPYSFDALLGSADIPGGYKF